MTEPVTRFSGEYAFLSSFAQIPFMYNIPGFGLVQLPDREHGFQALKTDHPEQIRAVLYAGSAAGAKRQGRQVTMRPCWEQDRQSEMLSLILAQFRQNPACRGLLAATGDAELVEGNTWNDTFWGAIPLEHCSRYETSLPVWAGMTFHGHNWLGRSLMAARHFLC